MPHRRAQLGFDDVTLERDVAWRALGWALDVVFIADVCINLRTGFLEPRTGVLVMDPKRAARNYLLSVWCDVHPSYGLSMASPMAYQYVYSFTTCCRSGASPLPLSVVAFRRVAATRRHAASFDPFRRRQTPRAPPERWVRRRLAPKISSPPPFPPRVTRSGTRPPLARRGVHVVAARRSTNGRRAIARGSRSTSSRRCRSTGSSGRRRRAAAPRRRPRRRSASCASGRCSRRVAHGIL